MSGYPCWHPAPATARPEWTRRADELFAPFVDPAACTLDAVADPERLLAAYDRLDADGGRAPGPDGVRYEHLGRREVASILRDASGLLRRGRYRPGGRRLVPLPKPGGGTRTIQVGNLLDRVVAKSVAMALERTFDPTFSDWSYGFRPGLSHHHLLADLEIEIGRTGRFVLAIDDVRGAFDHLRIEDALGSVRETIRNAGLRNLVERILRAGDDSGRATGIAQGCPLSPLVLNLVLHRVHDAPLAAGVATPSHVRYVDNLAYAVEDVPEGRRVLGHVGGLLAAAGLALKGADGGPVDLRHGTAQLLGFALSWRAGRLRLAPGAGAWPALDQALQQAHHEVDPPRAARQAVHGWIASGGPAFESRSRVDTVDRIVGRARRQGFRELSRDDLRVALGAAHDRWLSLREAGRGRAGVLASPTPPRRAGQPCRPEASAPGAEPEGGADH